MGFLRRILHKSSRSSEPSDAIKTVFDKIRQFLADEAAQNEMYASEARGVIVAGAPVDEIVGGVGDFGREPTNPIPVNGFIGEVLYISELRTRDDRQVIGHRLGTIRQIDVFEVVSLDGADWALLYFDMYHPKKSRRVPAGYTRQKAGFIVATNYRVPDFPRGIRDAVSLCTKGFLGVPLVAPELFAESRFDCFVRPSAHVEAVKELRLAGPEPAGS